MGALYSPLLLVTAWVETRQAHRIYHNRKHGENDEDTVEEWEQLGGQVDFEAEGWTKKVEASRPNVETDAAVLEVRELRRRVEELVQVAEGLKEGGGGG